jgi:1-deoxy-D-xylulose-5-phosphate synthase
VDGHDVNHLIKVLRDLKDIKGPKLLHCITVKGKGFKQAEIDQTTWHAPGKFNKETGEIIKESKPNTPPKFQDVFGHTILELAPWCVAPSAPTKPPRSRQNTTLSF